MAAHRHFQRSNEHAIVQLPVGCGKTGTMAILPFGLAHGRTLVVTPNLEITGVVSANLDYTSPDSFYQKAKVLENCGGPSAPVLYADTQLLVAHISHIVISTILP